MSHRPLPLPLLPPLVHCWAFARGLTNLEMVTDRHRAQSAARRRIRVHFSIPMSVSGPAYLGASALAHQVALELEALGHAGQLCLALQPLCQLLVPFGLRLGRFLQV